LLINTIKLENSVFIEKLGLENSLQASKIVMLENAIASNSTANTVSISQPMLDFEVVRFVLICLSVVGLVIGSYYCFHFFFQKSIIGKVIGGLNYWACNAFDKTFCGGSSFVKTIIIPFNEQNIELKVEIIGNDTIYVTYKYLADKVFIPFEDFLKDHQALLELFESPDPDLAKITQNLIENTSKKVIDVIVTSPEVVLYAEDAFKAVSQL
jgi:hypothetical protein